jgi:acetyl esterase/lipase
LAALAAGQVIPLWPEGVPGARGTAAEERREDDRVSNVHVPTLTVFPPVGSPAETAVIICPGGSYARLSIVKEGEEVASELARRGIAAFVLKYRLTEYGHPAPLQDVLRAIRLVRARAREFGVRADRIGVLGFSAGGHLAASAATLFDAPEGRTGAVLDGTSARPDFAGLIYPVILMAPPFAHQNSRRNLLGEHPSQALVDRMSLDLQVTAATPPTFLVHTAEDKTVPIENSIAFYEALRRAGVPAQLQLFDRGPHGFAGNPDLGPASAWLERFVEWMASYGWAAANPPLNRRPPSTRGRPPA